MVVVSEPVANKICEQFMHNTLMQDQGNPTFLSLMSMHK